LRRRARACVVARAWGPGLDDDGDDDDDDGYYYDDDNENYYEEFMQWRNYNA
jgi:hypothetical protein